MKERPILFSGPMVRALLAETKTQTRRIIKPQPLHVTGRGRRVYRDEDFKESWARLPGMTESLDPYVDCPYGRPGYGRPGDQLWVRETWRSGLSLDKWSPKQIATSAFEAGYRRPWAPIRFEADESVNEYGHTLMNFGDEWGKTRVSIHMPRWASRITLEITNVRVERLQEISESDAVAEGLKSMPPCFGHGWQSLPPSGDGWCAPTLAYRELWESINGPNSWDLNPYVWVIEFKKLPKETT